MNWKFWKNPAPQPALTPEQKLFAAVETLNAAWAETRENPATRQLSPWISWETKSLHITERKTLVLYEPKARPKTFV